MRTLFILYFLSAAVLCGGPRAFAETQAANAEPKTSMEWFQRASEHMNLRMPGSSPFHMKVTFHALPGEELLAPGKSEILTGDGVYEEVWLAPHTWRREVTLAGYHAVEVESDKGRKMQASSDYEPSRVLMLLNAVLEPITRNLVSTEFRHEGASGWEVDHLQMGGIPMVRISKSHGFGADFSDAYYFSPRGLLELRNQEGFITEWTGQAVFAGTIVPRHLVMKTGDRDLLLADVSIEDAGHVDAAVFDLPVDRADPGMTLRPLQKFEVRFNPDDTNIHPPLAPMEKNYALSIWGVFDRTGKYRELEFIYGVGVDKGYYVRELMDAFRKGRWHRAEIDGNPCEYMMPFGAVGEIHAHMGR